jgi:hypothetical protein
MTAQLIPNLPWSEYAVPGFLGSSALDDWPAMSREAWSAKHLESAYQGGGSPAMSGGSALDALLTDGEAAFAEKFAVKPEGLDGRAKEGKVWVAENRSKQILSFDQEQQIRAALPRAKEAIEAMRGDGVVGFQTTLRGEIAGGKVQTRPDIQIGDHFPDLKYVNGDAFTEFDRQFIYSRYAFQAGLFFGLARDAGIESPRVSFLLVESGTTMPRVEVVEIDETTLLWCWRHTVERVEEITQAIASPLGMVDAVKFRRIDLPVWAQKAIEG